MARQFTRREIIVHLRNLLRYGGHISAIASHVAS